MSLLFYDLAHVLYTHTCSSVSALVGTGLTDLKSRFLTPVPAQIPLSAGLAQHMSPARCLLPAPSEIFNPKLSVILLFLQSQSSG